MDQKDFLLWENASRQTIDFKMVYVDICDDINGGLLLSQIIYWHLPSKETGKTKLRVQKEGFLWLAKSREEWHGEIRLKPKQVDRAIKLLKDLGIIETKVFKFKSNPTTHIRLIWDKFLELLDQEMKAQPLGDMVIPQTGITNFPKQEEPSSPNGNNDVPQTGISLTESTVIDFDIDFNKEITTTSTRDKIDNELKKLFPNVDIELAKQQAFEKFEIKTDNQYYASVLMKLHDLSKKPKKTKAPTVRKEMLPDWLKEQQEEKQVDQEEKTEEQLSREAFEAEKKKLFDRIKSYKDQSQ